MKSFSLLALALNSTVVFADTDLSIPGEKWLGKFTGFICSTEGAKVDAPQIYKTLNVKFENVVTDSTLDNGVMKATFESSGNVCRYSAIMLADNTAQTITMLESKAYSNTEGVDCSDGKAILDTQFAPINKYYYYGHPHNMALMVESTDAEAICGAGATSFGVNFVVAGRVK